MRGTLRYELLAVLPVVVMIAGVMMASPARAATFVYVGNAESNDLYVLQLDRQSGDLTVVEHFGMHTGQIIMLNKIRTGEDLKLWRPPNITSP